MATYQADALVIRTREHGEADKLLTLFSREHGKLQAVAKGVRKPTSRQRAGAQLFTYGDFLLHRGRTWDTVNQASPRESFAHLWSDLDENMAAMAIAELLDAATAAGQSLPQVFTLTLSVFFLLEHFEPVILQCSYTIRLLAMLGYAPVLHRCVECGSSLKGETVKFDPERGGVICPRCVSDGQTRIIKAGSAAFMQQLLLADIRKIDRLRWPLWMQTEIRTILQEYCELKFEKRLRSWRMGENLTGGVGLDSTGRKGESPNE